MKHPVVLKFGGSSVGSPERFRRAIQVVQRLAADRHRVVVIASALSGVTNKLVALADATLPSEVCHAHLDWLRERHQLHAAAVLSLRAQRLYNIELQQLLAALEMDVFDRSGGAARKDALLAAGERLSHHIVALALDDAGLSSCATDAAELIKTDDRFGEAVVDLVQTRAAVNAWYDKVETAAIPVVTGFVGSAPDGRTTTLGRGGSDYSAALIAASLGASRLERWTDVDGIYNKDPRLDKHAVRFEELVLEDTIASNRAGKLGMHSKALDPLLAEKIPVFVRSIDHLDWPGTVIRPKCQKLARTG
ncbi:MAG: aspartate kinase [Bacteroidota bacterium]